MKIRTFGFLMLVISSAVQAAPVSDLATDIFEKGPQALAPGTRSPFLPGRKMGGEIDLNTLVVQGTIVGPGKKLALLSGRILKEGEALGRYRVKEIASGQMTLALDDSSQLLRMEGNPSPSRSKGGFQVIFENADLRDALSLLALAAEHNLIVPQEIAGRVTVSFEGVELMEALRSILRVNGYGYAVEGGVLRVGRPEAFAGGTDLRTVNITLKYATAKELADKLKPMLSDRGSVIAEERSNTLIVKDRDAVIDQVQNLIVAVDRKDRQVLIEGRIVDASQNFARALGIRWGISGQGGKVNFSGTKSAGTNIDTNNPLDVNLGAANPTSGVGFIIGKLAGGTSIEAQITAAESKGDVKILSKPTVTTINNTAAKIRSGAKIYVKSTSSISVGTAGGTGASAATGGLQEIDTGIELTVTPQISPDDQVKMTIQAQQSEADFSRTVDGIPSILDSSASTTVLVKNGETTVIGGLYRTKTTKERKGVPGFQHIPVVGLMFQSRAKTRDDNELMIFITPKIL